MCFILCLYFFKFLDAFQMNEDQFIDLCILLGCDYCETIYGIGPKRGIKLVQEHKSIEKILEVIDKKKYIVQEKECVR